MDRETPRAEATLELELAGDSPAGELRSPDGVKRSFSGWTELASAIEEWRSGTDPAKGDEDETASR